jgi:hypothetical protein
VPFAGESAPAPGAPDGGADTRQIDGVKQQNPQENDPFSEGDLQTAALTWAGQGAAVFPLYGVADGVCDCREGSECRSAGKHPLARLVPRSVKDATTDPETIRRWWASAPLANLSVAMGGPHRLLAVDVDPRAGGDASLCDLVEAHGDEWLETFTVRTGGNGHHFIFRLPEGVEVHRAKLAPGIDVKAKGGYLVAAPSAHASGRRYEVEKNTYAAEAPAWLVEELTRARRPAFEGGRLPGAPRQTGGRRPHQRGREERAALPHRVRAVGRRRGGGPALPARAAPRGEPGALLAAPPGC